MVIVVGGGISGVACAGELNARGIAVQLHDRGHKLGGRMASRVIRDSETKFDGHIVDIGASYFTASAESFSAVVADWQSRGLARGWTDSFHRATPQGVAGVRGGPMRFAAPARKELGVATIFNILGPLSNPAKPKAAAIGVANDRMHLVMAQVLASKGCDGFVFRGDDGLDEVSLSTTTTIIQISKGKLSQEVFDPTELGIAGAAISDIAGGDAKYNASITNQIFAGKAGPMRDAVTLNAAFAIAAFKGDFDLPLSTQIANGFVLANKAIDSGAAQSVLKKWVELSNEIVSAR